MAGAAGQQHRFRGGFIPLYTGDADKERILSFTHSGKVPALIDGDVTIWDSLSMIEYIAERRFRKPGCGRRTRATSRMRARSQPRCIRRFLQRCAMNAA